MKVATCFSCCIAERKRRNAPGERIPAPAVPVYELSAQADDGHDHLVSIPDHLALTLGLPDHRFSQTCALKVRVNRKHTEIDASGGGASVWSRRQALKETASLKESIGLGNQEMRILPANEPGYLSVARPWTFQEVGFGIP